MLAHLGTTAEAAGLAASVAVAAAVYTRGVSRLWAQAGRGRGVEPWRAACFGGGLMVVVVALMGPLPDMAASLFSAHMAQHQLLLTVAPLLIVAGKPWTVSLWAIPKHRRRGAARWHRRLGTGPVALRTAATVLLIAVVWGWHAPVAYEGALASPLVHVVEHGTLLGAGLLFWTALTSGAERRLGASVLALFVAGAAVAVLSALLLFAGESLYPSYAEAAAGGGGSAVADQRLAALIMWMPSSVIGLTAAVIFFTRWLAAVEAGDGRLGRDPGSAPAGIETAA